MLPLEVLLGSLTCSDLGLVLLILLDSLYQVVSALRWSEVRHSDMNALLDDSSIHLI